MASINLDEQCTTISRLRVSNFHWTLKVLVPGVAPIREYGSGSNVGIYQPITFVDEEGTKVHATLFNRDVKTWSSKLQPNSVYYLINGKVKTPKGAYPSAHKDYEIEFTMQTTVEKCDTNFSTVGFSNSFSSFEVASQIPENVTFNILGILVHAKGSTGVGNSTRREIILMNERCEQRNVILWGDLAIFDDEVLQNLLSERPIIALCNVKNTRFKGTHVTKYVTGTNSLSFMLNNPTFESSMALQNWHNRMKEQNKDITLMPTQDIQHAKKVEIVDILQQTAAINGEKYCKFTATIIEIPNKSSPWYPACNKCLRRVNFLSKMVQCPQCEREDDYADRYRLEVHASNDGHSCKVVLFEAARHLIGCDIKTYQKSLATAKETSTFYRKLELHTGKDFTFLIKLEAISTSDQVNGRLVAEEVHKVETQQIISVEDDDNRAKDGSSKKNKNTEETAQGVVSKKIKVEKN